MAMLAMLLALPLLIHAGPACAAAPVYRFFNSRLGVHFYTATEAERNAVQATLGYVYAYEGAAYGVDPAADVTPLYRFFNTRTGTHFYTADEAERDNARANLGQLFSYEGQAYGVSPVSGTGGVTVHRFYRSASGTHFYTADEDERAYVQGALGRTYTYEGPAFRVAESYGGYGVPTNAPHPEVVSIALSKLGAPYLYGAAGPDRFDCSGFTMWAYAHIGIRLPHSSLLQASVGQRVARAYLEPGDLVFFGAPVGHVGIYIGDGNFVHSPSTGDVVKVTSLASRRDYTGAARP